MGSDASSAADAMGVLRAAVPLQPDADLVLATGGGGERGQVVGLVLVDVSNGFCTVGAGNLVSYLPPSPRLSLSLSSPSPVPYRARATRIDGGTLGWLGCAAAWRRGQNCLCAGDWDTSE
jgi:hypothetical protein